MRGYWGRLRRVDLSTGDVREEDVPETVFRRFLGGKGLAAWALVSRLEPDVDPLSPSNQIAIAAGPLQASSLPSTGRCAMAAKSPLTSLYLDSFVGGEFGNAFKRAGQDVALFAGRCEQPSVILFSDDGARVEPAPGLWGKGTKEATRELKRRFPSSSVLCIGQAGERGVRFACAIADERRAVGRGGLGAALGSKNVKAIVAAGTRMPEPHDPDAVRAVAREMHERMRKARKKGSSFYKFGTMTSVEYANVTGRFPVRNFRSGRMEGYEALTAESVYERHEVKNTSCAVCGVACEGHVEERPKTEAGAIPQKPAGPEAGDAKERDVVISSSIVERPEYEAVAMLGGNLDIRDYETIVRANALCNDLGLDVISTGNLAGFIMEANDCGCGPGGLRFGDGERLLEFIRTLGEEPRRLGDVMYGVRALSSSWGHGVEKFAMHVKGLELPAWDPRGKLGAGLAYMTADIGGSHLRDYYHTKRVPNVSAVEVVPELVRSQDEMAFIDSAILCLFTREPAHDLLLGGIEALTGMRLSEADALNIGERTWNLVRSFNVACGVGRRDDRLPLRWMEEPLDVGPAKGCTSFADEEDARRCLDEYYRLRGWDPEGRPMKKKLEELGISDPIPRPKVLSASYSSSDVLE